MHITAKLAFEAYANSRRVEREDIEVSTTLRASGVHSLEIVVRNISTLGFMADATGDFATGDRVRVRLPSLGTVTARLVWARGGQIGCEFDQEIDLSKLRAILAATGAAPARRNHRPRLIK